MFEQELHSRLALWPKQDEGSKQPVVQAWDSEAVRTGEGGGRGVTGLGPDVTVSMSSFARPFSQVLGLGNLESREPVSVA